MPDQMTKQDVLMEKNGNGSVGLLWPHFRMGPLFASNLVNVSL